MPLAAIHCILLHHAVLELCSVQLVAHENALSRASGKCFASCLRRNLPLDMFSVGPGDGDITGHHIHWQLVGES